MRMSFIKSSISRCPERNIISPFVYDKENGRAEATLYSMFKFPDSNRVHFQCDILVCKGKFVLLILFVDFLLEIVFGMIDAIQVGVPTFKNNSSNLAW